MNIHEELEDAMGVVLKGDITPIVVDLLKGTDYKKELLNYLGRKTEDAEEERESTPELNKPSLLDLFDNSVPIIGR